MTALGQLFRFGWTQAQCCAFSVLLFAGMAAVRLAPALPLARYDLLLACGIALTALMWTLGVESGRDVLAVLACHVLGLALELVKVHVGSWSYPEHALTKLAGVPLYSGFMYAAVGSYVCCAWRLLRLRVTGYRPLAVPLLAAALFVNFLTDHWLPDVRLPLAALLVAALWGTTVRFTVGGRDHRMPLTLSFVLIGFFLWLAENIATFLGAWRYPYQRHGWQPVSTHEWGSWTLLIAVLFALVRLLAPGAQERNGRRVRAAR
ncbi:DUF817 domain-containing protein [Streptacidiphilus jiangxiensis]|uniref:Uncharacterized membrane protein YoaT, DUF817 family n=1 Tax=Streptacidiphilus jiangxiensis TaxID=235985 RepID=A0A1H7KFB9_STRJI|nr:DUF817 domain-containing protein [Streptacidiphilus jiangxiensis]SEK85210.1 Uncharacterized membrane protein YoaT, DUF817 family [Streptacidiphilus jiangxiensis]